MGAEDQPSAGDALKGVQNGTLPTGTVAEILEAAPKDLKEKIIDVPEWGYSIKLKSFTAAQQAAVKERGFGFKGEETLIAWAEMEIMQFQQGVIEPRFDEDQVRQLHLSSGPGFNRVIDELDKLNKIDKEALRKAREEFQQSQQSAAAGVPSGGASGEDES